MAIFESFKLRDLTLSNRIGIAPMCTTMVTKKDGVATNFHLAHYTTFALGQVGVIIQEATAVTSEGRIMDTDLGLYNDTQEEALKKVVDSVHEQGGVFGIQLNHAGRKSVAGEGIIGPSAIAFEGYETPTMMDQEAIDRVVEAFRLSSMRAARIGYDFIEIHGAHGYLINQFMSPLSNKRTDRYKEPLELIKEIFQAIKSSYDGVITIRLSVEEYAEGGLHIQDYIKLVQELEAMGIEAISVSTGGVVGNVSYPVGPNYQVDFAAQLKKVLSIPVFVAGKIDTLEDVNAALETGIDGVLNGRLALRNPYYVLSYAKTLGVMDQLNIPVYLSRGFR